MAPTDVTRWYAGFAPLALLCWMAAFGAHAAEEGEYDTTIESAGRAEVEDDYHGIEFVLTRAYTAPTAVAAAEQALGFETLVRDSLRALAEAGTLPSPDLTAPRPGLPVAPWPVAASTEGSAEDAPTPQVTVEAQVRLAFTTLSFTSDVDPLVQLARLADNVASLAAQCGAEMRGPILKPRDAARTEREAIIRAVENAYIPAEAAAEALDSRIVAVHNTVVESVRWENAEPTTGGSAVTRTLTCRARVRVVYVLGPR